MCAAQRGERIPAGIACVDLVTLALVWAPALLVVGASLAAYWLGRRR